MRLESISRVRGGKTFEVPPKREENKIKPLIAFVEKGTAAAWTFFKCHWEWNFPLPMVFCVHGQSFAVMGVLQLLDIQLCHLHKGFHDATGFFLIGIQEEFGENGRNDLPGKTKFVHEPTALQIGSTLG